MCSDPAVMGRESALLNTSIRPSLQLGETGVPNETGSRIELVDTSICSPSGSFLEGLRRLAWIAPEGSLPSGGEPSSPCEGSHDSSTKVTVRV